MAAGTILKKKKQNWGGIKGCVAFFSLRSLCAEVAEGSAAWQKTKNRRGERGGGGGGEEEQVPIQ